MLSYQHAYHAGNLADLHKHALLASALDYMTRKDKPISYIETHSGRGLYDLTGAEAAKTGEAAQGIGALGAKLGADTALARTLDVIRKQHGAQAYPGSPLIARTLLRPTDQLHLAELHPEEHRHLRRNLRAPNVKTYHQDGFELAASLCPPDPRRGLMLIDPSWEIKDEYKTVPQRIAKITRAWNVGVIALWYPILEGAPHIPMLRALPDPMIHEVRFPPARPGHRMTGSGMAVINPPYGLQEAADRVSELFQTAFPRGHKG